MLKEREDVALQMQPVSRMTQISEETRDIQIKIEDDPFKGEKNAKSYLLKEFELKWKWYKLKERIPLSKLELKKNKIKIKHTISQLKILKSDLSSELEQAKAYTAVIASIAIVVTILATVTNLIFNNSNRVADLIAMIDEKVIIKEENMVEIYRGQLEYANKITEQINLVGDVLLILSIVVLGSVAIIISSIKTLARLNELVSQAIDEKIEEDQRVEESLQQEQEEMERYKLSELIKKREELDKKKIRLLR